MKPMPKTLLLLMLAGGAVGGLLCACRQATRTNDEEKARGQPLAIAARVRSGTNGEITLTLDSETAKRIALQVEPLVAVEFQPEVKGYGRVLDPTPLAALVAELATARVAAEASRLEYERLRVLHEQNNASTRALQTAEAAAQRDALLAESLRTRLVLGWGHAVAEQSDLPALVRSLTDLGSTLVRIELPAGESLTSQPRGARLLTLQDEEQGVEAQFLGPATTTDPQTQGQGFLFLVRGKAPGLTPNTGVTGYLRIPGEPAQGVIIPSDAVVRQAEKAWVYVQRAAGEYVRRQVPLDQVRRHGYFVRSGFAPGDRLVVAGAQVLLSEELKSETTSSE